MSSKVELKEGISVIVPREEESNITPLLNSIKEQTLDNDLFEIIFVLNEDDNVKNIIEDYQAENPEINMTLAHSDSEHSGFYHKGVKLSGREYITFIDGGDYISQDYLEKFYENANPNRIVISPLMEVDENGDIHESYLTSPLLKTEGIVENPFASVFGSSINIAKKLVPTIEIKNNLFNKDSFEYYNNLYYENDFEIFILGSDENSAYYKVLKGLPSYESNIVKPLENIKELNKLLSHKENKALIRSLIDSEVLFINEYVLKHQDELEKIMYEIDECDFEYFSYKLFNEDLSEFGQHSNELVISYAFPPVTTTSSNDVTKKILRNKRNVDVICGTLANEAKDELLFKIVDEYVDDLMFVDVNDYFFYSGGKKFGKEGLEILNEKQTYDNIYSCIQFIPAHYLGYLYKINHDTFWTAEFSDPVIHHYYAGYMSSPINDQEMVDEINATLPEGFDKVKVTDTVNEIIEYITYIFADRIIFTNEKQKELMVNDFPKLKDMVAEKSIIKRHPTLEEKYYYLKRSDYEVDEDYVNFAYFGVLYGNRSFEEFINGFDSLSDEFKDKFRLHIFSPNREIFEQVLSPDLLERTIINDPVNYFEFLNLTTKMDILMVEDSIVDGLYSFNPYLPSKVSDYKGTQTDIWAVCDKNSIMDGMDEIKYKSYLNDINSSVKTLNQIMSDKLGIDVESNDLSAEELFDYYKLRHSHLVNKIDGLSKQKNNEISLKSSLINDKNKLISEKNALISQRNQLTRQNEKLVLENKELIKEKNALISQNRFYENRIREYSEYVAYLRKWMRPRFLFKAIKKVRNAYRKIKN